MRWTKELLAKLSESLYEACCREANNRGIEHLSDQRIKQFVSKTVALVGGKIVKCQDHEVPYVMNKNSKRIASSITIWNPVSPADSLIFIPKEQAEKIVVLGWP